MVLVRRTDLIMQPYSTVAIRGSVRAALCVVGAPGGEQTKNSTPGRSRWQLGARIAS